MNIEHRTSNVEWEKMKKQTYDPKERLLIKKPELLSDILQETEELIRIFVTSIKTAVRQVHGPERSRRAEKKQK